MTKNINGERYDVLPTVTGFFLSAEQVQTDRAGNKVNRNYAVVVDENGYAVSCTCPDHVYRQKPCKHMDAVDVRSAG